MKRKIKRQRGRPTSFNAQKAATILALAKHGKTDAQISQIIGVSPRTLAYWKATYSDFMHALKDAKQNADNLVELSLYRRALGYTCDEERIHVNKNGKITKVPTVKHYPPDTSAMIFWLKNRNPKAWRDAHQLEMASNVSKEKKSFEVFCKDAGYPPPYAKQMEMKEFGTTKDGARLLLGARGYGKTDYITILGTAYEMYLDFLEGSKKFSSLIVTKSDERNAAILSEISKAASINGVTFEKENASSLRVSGLHGKDHSVSAVTIGTSSLRGRHPKFILMDDPVTEEDVSEATRKKVQRVYNELNKLCSNILVIGQPVHKQDLYEKLRPLLKKMEVPYGSIPELDADLEAQRLAGVSEESIQASYFLKVISENAAPLENVKFIDTFPVGGQAVAFIDPSFEGGDYTAISIIKGYFDGVVVQGRVWKRPWNHVLDDMVKEMLLRGVKRVCFETNCLGDQPIIMLRQALPEGIGVVGKKSTGFKHSRIMNAGPYAERIHIAKSSDRVYIEQVVMYEYGATNDDAPDSLATGLEWIGLIRGKKV